MIINRLRFEYSKRNSDLKDYKFFCFDGVPKFCQVIGGRNETMTIDFFDMQWHHQPFHEPRIYPFADIIPQQPMNFSDMQDVARRLSKDHPFLRVDFYEVKGKIYFGELTFYPTSGFGGFNPDRYDELWGDYIHLPFNK